MEEKPAKIIHKCPNCDRIFKRKCHIDRHIQKNACKEYNYTCRICQKKFASQSGMYRHMRETCKVKKENNKDKLDLLNRMSKLDMENSKLKKEMAKMKRMMKKNNGAQTINNNNNTINDTTINGNVTNNIMLVGYGRENIKDLDEKELLKVLASGYDSPIKLTEAIHFNPKHPEYQNIYITNAKGKYATKYDGESWKLTNKNNLIEDLYDTKKECIEENLSKFDAKLTTSSKNAIRRWLKSDEEQQDPSNAKKIKRIKDDLHLLLYNKRNIPIETKEAGVKAEAV